MGDTESSFLSPNETSSIGTQLQSSCWPRRSHRNPRTTQDIKTVYGSLQTNSGASLPRLAPTQPTEHGVELVTMWSFPLYVLEVQEVTLQATKR